MLDISSLTYGQENEDVAIIHEDLANPDILTVVRKQKMDDLQMEVRVIQSLTAFDPRVRPID
jgi:rRNA maturation protein Rpf1